jgi:hypothetical protein
MRAPIIAIERGGEVHVFSTVVKAESFIEPDDVKSRQYDIYDSTGAIISASVHRTSGLFSPERVSLSDTGNGDAATLRDRIGSYLMRVGVSIDSQMSLPAMLGEVSIYAGDEPRGQ